jgi:hypothetical protein
MIANFYVSLIFNSYEGMVAKWMSGPEADTPKYWLWNYNIDNKM